MARHRTVWVVTAGVVVMAAAANSFHGELRAEQREVLGEISPVSAPLLTLTQQAKLTASDGGAGDAFGLAVALSGNTALVGAHADDVGANADQGSAYVFVRSGATWVLQAKLLASDGKPSDGFGYSVALWGDTAMVGAPFHDVGSKADQGAVYVFVRSGSTWSQQAKLVASDGAAGDRFGYSLALGQGRAVIGAPWASPGGNNYQGATYVFGWTGSGWSQQAKLMASDGTPLDYFGSSVALSGDHALIGAKGAEAAYVFIRLPLLGWVFEAKLKASDPATLDGFGDSVALNGSTALVGAPGKSSNRGAAYVFLRAGNSWAQQAKLQASDGQSGDQFGASVALNGDTVLIGAPFCDVNYQDQGCAYFFQRFADTWSLRFKLAASDGARYDQFGLSASLDHDTAVVGGPFHDAIYADQGAAYVFTWKRPTAVFRDSATSLRLLRYNTQITHNAGGLFASDPSAAQNGSGDTYVVARDNYNSLWANGFNSITLNWGTWSLGGGITRGTPAIAVSTDGTAYIAARDAWNSYWLTRYVPPWGFDPWIYLAGIFSTDPVMCAAPDGSLYIIGKDDWNSLWSGRYVPGTGFQNWVWGQGIVKGKPSVACGTDNAAYVAVRDNWDSLWMARVSGNSWTGWHWGGGIMSADPQAASAGAGVIYAALRDPWGGIWYRGFTEGTGSNWLSWVFTGGILQDLSPAGVGGELYIAGRDGNNGLWWYRATTGWSSAGNVGVAAGPLAAAPK